MRGFEIWSVKISGWTQKRQMRASNTKNERKWSAQVIFTNLFMRDDELPQSVMWHVESFFQCHLNLSMTFRSALGPILITLALKARYHINKLFERHPTNYRPMPASASFLGLRKLEIFVVVTRIIPILLLDYRGIKTVADMLKMSLIVSEVTWVAIGATSEKAIFI